MKCHYTNSIIKFTFYLFSLIFIFNLTNCSLVNKKENNTDYSLSDNEQIKRIELIHHTECKKLNLEKNYNENIDKDLYWKCRLNLIEKELQTIQRQGNSNNYYDYENLVDKIKNNIERIKSSYFEEANKKLDAMHHKKCVSMGYKFETTDKKQTDKYLECRKNLIEQENTTPAFRNDEYLKHPNNNFSMNFIINNQVDNEIIEEQQLKHEFPTCMKYNVKTQDFENCKNAYKLSQQCYHKIGEIIEDKGSEEKKSCQIKAYIRYPDNLIKSDNENISQRKNEFDKYGITDVSKFQTSKPKKDFEIDTNNITESEKTTNNKKVDLYSRVELGILRHKFINLCMDDVNIRLAEHEKKLKEECERKSTFHEEKNINR